MKISIVIPLWRRAEIFQLVSTQLEIFTQTNKKYDFRVVFIISPEDNEIVLLKKIIEKATYNFSIVYHSNRYLGEKINAGINAALDCDYIMNAGSDDLLHPGLMKLYEKNIKNVEFFFGINSVYFFDMERKKNYFFQYETEEYSIGAGRMIFSEIVKYMKRKKITLYNNHLQRGLDTNSSNNIKKLGICEKIIKSDYFPYIVDLKSKENINSIERIKTSKHNNMKAMENIIIYENFLYFETILKSMH